MTHVQDPQPIVMNERTATWSLATIAALIGLIVSAVTLGAFIYNAGRSQERTAAALRKLCEHVLVLEQIAISEHAAYSASIYVNKGCDE